MEKGNGNEANETYINTLRKKKEGTRNTYLREGNGMDKKNGMEG